MLNIIFPNGDKRTYEDGTSAREIAASLSNSLAKSAVGALVNGEKKDLNEPLCGDVELKILTFENEEGRDMFHHSSSHILAAAVQKLFPGTKLAIGPAVSNGFYYDFDSEHIFTEEDFPAIEAEMAKIVAANFPFEKSVLSREDALAYFAGKGEDYKVELINDLPADAVISLYKDGDFVDLCAGPHIPSTGMVKAIKLMSLAGAYWRGDSDKKMLQRIYATSFPKQAMLDDYLQKLEEAKRRDHRKLGKELGLFLLLDEGPGFPFFLPKGMIVKNTLIDFWRQVHREAGYSEISTPIMLNRALWERSGHWGHYKNNMYTTVIDEMDFAIKPMNCPGGMLVYQSEPHSYRDLPLRVGELGIVHRHELSGALHGLMRVRCFTQDDAHIFMTREQIKDEIKGVAKLIDKVYSVFGFSYHVELSTMPEDHIGSEEDWELATDSLKAALDELNLEYIINEGDGAFYGPKIDFHLTDCLGRTWQCGTIQLDFQMPERFELEYTGADGEKHRPVMIHRVVFGSIERFIGILTEHYAGAFPLWLAPVQVKVLNITDNQLEYAQKITDALNKAGFRAELDSRNEKIGYKIRSAQNEKIPYMLVIGAKEAENGEVAVRHRSLGDQGAMSFDAFMSMIKEESEQKINK